MSDSVGFAFEDRLKVEQELWSIFEDSSLPSFVRRSWDKKWRICCATEGGTIEEGPDRLPRILSVSVERSWCRGRVRVVFSFAVLPLTSSICSPHSAERGQESGCIAQTAHTIEEFRNIVDCNEVEASLHGQSGPA